MTIIEFQVVECTPIEIDGEQCYKIVRKDGDVLYSTDDYTQDIGKPSEGYEIADDEQGRHWIAKSVPWDWPATA